MVAWRDFALAEPDLAERVRERLDAGRHKTMATLRADGSPRISGIECEIADGELRFGSMPGSRKGADLRRDPRFALHGPTVHPVEGQEGEWPGEVKIAGRAVPFAGSSEDEGEAFTADITEVVLTALDETVTKLVVECGPPRPGGGASSGPSLTDVSWRGTRWMPVPPGPRHGPDWYDQADEPQVLEPGDRVGVPCRGGPSLARLELYPPRLEIAERGGIYALVDVGPRADWYDLFVPHEP